MSSKIRFINLGIYGGFPWFHGTPVLVLVATENFSQKSKTNCQIQQVWQPIKILRMMLT